MRERPPSVEFEVFEPKSDREVPGATVTRAKATCICCGVVLPPDRVRAQLAAQKGGADVIFDTEGNRTGGARMTAVVTLKPSEKGRHYRLPHRRGLRGGALLASAAGGYPRRVGARVENRDFVRFRMSPLLRKTRIVCRGVRFLCSDMTCSIGATSSQRRQKVALVALARLTAQSQPKSAGTIIAIAAKADR